MLGFIVVLALLLEEYCGSSASAADYGAGTQEQGHYLATVANCISCHTRPGGRPFAGGVSFDTPFGTIYSTNITPDVDTGIGRWSETDFIRAMHEGIAADGRRLYPAFPYVSFTKVNDDDVKLLYAYLRTIPPVRFVPPENGIMFRQRWGLMLWDKMFFRPDRYKLDTSRSAEWNRGAYLVMGLGHCGECHTPRNIFMASRDPPFTGGSLQDKVTGNKNRRWSAVNLTSSSVGLGSWSVDEIARYLSLGYSPRGGAFGPMNDVIVGSTRHMSVEDIRAVAVYLKSISAEEPIVDDGPTADQLNAGLTIYTDRCEKCHLASGRGGLFSGPRLAGNAVVQAVDPASLINVILYGPNAPAELRGYEGWETMNPYGDILSDDEVAAVSNYVRGSWGNKAPMVAGREVARQR